MRRANLFALAGMAAMSIPSGNMTMVLSAGPSMPVMNPVRETKAGKRSHKMLSQKKRRKLMRSKKRR